MPCTDGTPPWAERVVHNRLEKATQILCAFCTEQEAAGKPIPPVMVEWWIFHKESDRIRKDDEEFYKRYNAATHAERMLMAIESNLREARRNARFESER